MPPLNAKIGVAVPIVEKADNVRVLDLNGIVTNMLHQVEATISGEARPAEILAWLIFETDPCERVVTLWTAIDADGQLCSLPYDLVVLSAESVPTAVVLQAMKRYMARNLTPVQETFDGIRL